MLGGNLEFLTFFLTLLAASQGFCIQTIDSLSHTMCVQRHIYYWNRSFGNFYRLQTKFAKVMFLLVSVILSMGGGWYPSMPCRSPGPNQGEVEGSGQQGLQTHTGGGVYPTMHWGRHPPSRRLLLWAVCILLECILVWNKALLQLKALITLSRLHYTRHLQTKTSHPEISKTVQYLCFRIIKVQLDAFWNESNNLFLTQNEHNIDQSEQ